MQDLDLTLNGTYLTAAFGAAAAGDIETLSLTSAGSAANTLDLGAGADLNDAAGESIQVAGTQNLTVRSDDAGIDGLVINKAASYTGELTVRVDAPAVPAPLDVSLTSADTVRLDVDQANSAVTVANGVNLDLRADQTVATNLLQRLATNSAADEVTLTLTSDATGLALAGLDFGSTGGQEIETVNIVTNGPPALGTTPHTLGGVTGSATTGSDLNISGGDRVQVGAITGINNLDASSMANRLTVSVDVDVNASSDIKAGSSTSDILTVLDAANNQVTVDASQGTATSDTLANELPRSCRP